MPLTDFDFNRGVSLTELIQGLPAGLDRAVLRVLSFHTGRKLAISRGDLRLAADWDELNEYLERELHSRAMDLLEQESALKAAGERMWGRYSPGVQMSLFESADRRR